MKCHRQAGGSHSYDIFLLNSQPIADARRGQHCSKAHSESTSRNHILELLDKGLHKAMQMKKI